VLYTILRESYSYFCSKHVWFAKLVALKTCGFEQKYQDLSLKIVYSTETYRKNVVWGRDFPPVQTGPGAHPTSCKMGTGSFPGVKCGRGVLLTTHPLLVPQSWKSRAIPLPTLWATAAL